jgi:hypothetical protein
MHLQSPMMEGLIGLVSSAYAWVQGFGIDPLRCRQWPPLRRLNDAARIAFEKTRASDRNLVVSGTAEEERMRFHLEALLEDYRNGLLVIYGQHPPSEQYEPIPIDEWGRYQLSRDASSLLLPGNMHAAIGARAGSGAIVRQQFNAATGLFTVVPERWDDLCVSLVDLQKHCKRLARISRRKGAATRQQPIRPPALPASVGQHRTRPPTGSASVVR